jgi:enolase
VAKAAADYTAQPLYRYVGGTAAHVLPVPMMNIVNGGEHADNPIDIQEFMIMPVGADQHRRCRARGLRGVPHAEEGAVGGGPFHRDRRRGRLRARHLVHPRRARFHPEIIEKAGYTPGDDVMLALDCAATEYFKDGKYVFAGEGKTLSAEKTSPTSQRFATTTRSCRSRMAVRRMTGTAGRC